MIKRFTRLSTIKLHSPTNYTAELTPQVHVREPLNHVLQFARVAWNSQNQHVEWRSKSLLCEPIQVASHHALLCVISLQYHMHIISLSTMCRRSFWRGKKARVTTREVLLLLNRRAADVRIIIFRASDHICGFVYDGVYCVHSIYIYYARRLLLLAYHISQQLSY